MAEGDIKVEFKDKSTDLFPPDTFAVTASGSRLPRRLKGETPASLTVAGDGCTLGQLARIETRKVAMYFNQTWVMGSIVYPKEGAKA